MTSRPQFTSVNLATDVTVVTTRPAKLLGAYVTTAMSAQACPIEDGGGTVVAALPASSAVGSDINCYGVVMSGITVNPDDAATGVITVIYEILDKT
jgi:hypothetical protein